MQFRNIALFGALCATTVLAATTSHTYTNVIQTGPSEALMVSDGSALDGPKLTPGNNATTFDWWYFDAVSTNGASAVVMVFYLSTDLGFPFVPPLSTLSVDIFATFDDGSLVFLPLNNLPYKAGQATVTTDGDGASGNWQGTGFSFEGSPDLSTYKVMVDSPILAIKGTLELKSHAPAHYPCGPNEAGQKLDVSPNVGWANAMPDADAVADFTVLGRPLKFTGVGYHDKNWGDKPFTTHVSSWYWGHGRLGPYSIVWFDVLGKDGTEYFSSYAAKDGKIIVAACGPGTIKVRPTGKNSQYPPKITSGNPEGLHIDLDLGAEGILRVDVKADTVLADAFLYNRMSGLLTGDHERCSAKEDSLLHAEATNPERSITKSQARVLTKQVAHGLRNGFGIGANGPGKDVVMVMCSGQSLLPMLFYGVIAAEGVYSAVSTSATVSELSKQMEQCPVSLLVCTPDTKEVACKAAEKCGLSNAKIVVLESSSEWSLRSLSTGTNYISEKQLDWRRITDAKELENSLICLLFSSGTTGPPKGVRLSHQNLVSEAVLPGDLSKEHLRKAEAAGEPPFEYRTLAHLPVAHIAGLQGYLVNPFYAGGLVYWMPKFDFQQFMDNMKKFRITMLFSVPAIYLLIAKSPAVTDHFDTLMLAQSGAAPLGPEIQRAASMKLGKGKTFISQTWGLSETTGSASSNLWGPKDETGSVGTLLPNISLRLVDEDFKDVETGKPGELLIKGPVISKGYYNNPEATAGSVHGDWFCTGDIGIMREEKLYIVDRKKELIKYNAHQVAPAELEAILLSHPLILDAAVIGVEGEGTELPRAYVVADQTKISKEQIHEVVNSVVASYKRLRGGVFYIDEIPKTASGKILRKDLRMLAKRTTSKL
ncbi:hypothetical protein V495_02405 [Pseudogymnoascus sp. VKM F-4514 (FW-929)]|nr:hypothetical protein V495_02405 [Pseudogymnoascus sp. VKM F-4514 (FW-929)]